MAKRTRIQVAKSNSLSDYKKLESLMAQAKGSYQKPKKVSTPARTARSKSASGTKSKSGKRTKQADAGRNARKRYTRTIERLKQAKELTYSPDMKAQYERQIQEVENSIKRTYAPKGGWKTEEQKTQFKEAITRGDKITEYTKAELGSSQRIKNFNFQQQLKWASSANKSALSYINEEEVKAFYHITQDIWNKPEIEPKDRNKAIMDYFGTKDLETAFNRAMSKPGVAELVGKQIVNRLLTKSKPEDLTQEQKDYLDEEGLEPGEQAPEGSPEWSMELTKFDPEKDWSDYLDGEGEE